MKDYEKMIWLAYVTINLIFLFGGIADKNFNSITDECAKPKTNGHFLVPGYSLGCWLASPMEEK